MPLGSTCLKDLQSSDGFFITYCCSRLEQLNSLAASQIENLEIIVGIVASHRCSRWISLWISWGWALRWITLGGSHGSPLWITFRWNHAFAWRHLRLHTWRWQSFGRSQEDLLVLLQDGGCLWIASHGSHFQVHQELLYLFRRIDRRKLSAGCLLSRAAGAAEGTGHDETLSLVGFGQDEESAILQGFEDSFRLGVAFTGAFLENTQGSVDLYHFLLGSFVTSACQHFELGKLLDAIFFLLGQRGLSGRFVIRAGQIARPVTICVAEKEIL